MDVKKGGNFVGVIPNALTIARLPLTAVFFGMILRAPDLPDTDRPRFLLLAFVLFVVTGITDIIDGWIARVHQVTSKFGRIADALLDKLLVCGSFVCFALVAQPRLDALAFPPLTMTIIRWAVALILIARELFVTILRQIAETRGVNFPAVASGKIKMLLQTFTIGAVIIHWACTVGPWADWFIALTAIVMLAFTIVSGIRSLSRPRRISA